MITAIHQFVPVLEVGATGQHTLEVQRVLQQLGLRSEVFAERSEGPYAGKARPYKSYGRRPGRHRGEVLLYQCSIGSWIGAYVLRRPEPLVVNYHNITPAEYFRAWEPGPAHGLGWGRGQLKDMRDRTQLGIADSTFNELELRQIGYRDTVVSPVMFDVEALAKAVDRQVLADLRKAKDGGGVDLLFVSRVAPHKAQHDLIRMLAVYRRLYDPRARLHLVGASSSDTYVTALRSMAHDLGVADAVNLTGGVPESVLAAYYASADAFVTASEHEGFCIPVIEAMYHRVPVIAYAAAAVPETVGPGGLLLRTKEPLRMAAAVAKVLSDATLRDELVRLAGDRVERFSLDRARSQFASAIETVLGAVA